MLSHFANPWGLFALLGIPAVLAIHFLQRRVRVIPVSTLFLLESTRDDTVAGRKLRRLVPSIPLWLQLLAVLLLTALLAEPRWPWRASVQRIAIVLDDSASMMVFKKEVADAVRLTASQASGLAARAEFLLLPTDPAKPRIHAGGNAQAAIQALESWHPAGGPVDPAPSLRLAREQVGRGGLVVFLSDTPADSLPADATMLAIGHPVPNAGITGVTIKSVDGKPIWEAMLANRSNASLERTWHLEWNGNQRMPEQAVTLAPGRFATIGGPIPDGARRLTLVLSPDAFTLDDTFPFVIPEPRPLTLHNTLPESMDWLPARLTRAVPALHLAAPSATADLALAGSYDGIFPALGDAILVCLDGKPDAAWLADPIIPARHPLNDGLSWDGLAVQSARFLPAKAGDTPLVWSGETPLVSLREVQPAADAPATRPRKHLVFHFNPARSNLDRLPAAAVLLLRFIEELRLEKPATAWEQIEPGQRLAPLLPRTQSGLAIDTLSATGDTLATRIVAPAEIPVLRAPASPGYFRVRVGETVLLEAAVAFADSREGDFSACASSGMPDTTHAAAARDATTSDVGWQGLVLATLAILLLTWWLLPSRPAIEADNS